MQKHKHHLKAVKGLGKEFSRSHFVLIGYENGQRDEGDVQPIAITDTFYWPAISSFVERPIMGNLYHIVNEEPEVCDGVISVGVY